MTFDNEKARQYAYDANERLIFVDSAIKGQKYFCVNCHLSVFPKKGEIRRHHFAHKSLSKQNSQEKEIIFDCIRTNEGYLHESYKNLIYQFLKEKMERKEEVSVIWKASNIGQQKKNLLKIAKDIKLEKRIGSKKNDLIPDITLYDKNEKAYTAIEIVVSHKPDRNKLSYYSKEKIYLLEIDINKEKMIESEEVEKLLKFPSIFSYIPDLSKEKTAPLSRSCNRCGQESLFSYINIGKIECPYCKSSNNAAYISVKNVNGKSFNYHFNQLTSIIEENLLDLHGLLYDKSTYNFICSNEDCKKSLFFDFSEIKNIITYPLGYYCPYCHGQPLINDTLADLQFMNSVEKKWLQYFYKYGINYDCDYKLFYLTSLKQYFRPLQISNPEDEKYRKERQKAEDEALEFSSKKQCQLVLGYENGAFSITDGYNFYFDDSALFFRCKDCFCYQFQPKNDDIYVCRKCGSKGTKIWDFIKTGSEGLEI